MPDLHSKKMFNISKQRRLKRTLGPPLCDPRRNMVVVRRPICFRRQRRSPYVEMHGDVVCARASRHTGRWSPMTLVADLADFCTLWFFRRLLTDAVHDSLRGDCLSAVRPFSPAAPYRSPVSDMIVHLISGICFSVREAKARFSISSALCPSFGKSGNNTPLHDRRRVTWQFQLHRRHTACLCFPSISLVSPDHVRFCVSCLVSPL